MIAIQVVGRRNKKRVQAVQLRRKFRTRASPQSCQVLKIYSFRDSTVPIVALLSINPFMGILFAVDICCRDDSELVMSSELCLLYIPLFLFSSFAALIVSVSTSSAFVFVFYFRTVQFKMFPLTESITRYAYDACLYISRPRKRRQFVLFS